MSMSSVLKSEAVQDERTHPLNELCLRGLKTPMHSHVGYHKRTLDSGNPYTYIINVTTSLRRQRLFEMFMLLKLTVFHDQRYVCDFLHELIHRCLGLIGSCRTNNQKSYHKIILQPSQQGKIFIQ